MRPQDVALNRRQQIQWLEERGQSFFEHTIQIGTQSLYPQAGVRGERIDISASTLVEEERRRLSNAKMWYIDKNTCELVSTAYGNMPPFQPQRHDLPSRNGFVVFDQPIMAKELEIDRTNFYDEVIQILLKDLGITLEDLGIKTEEETKNLTYLMVNHTETATNLMGLDQETRAYVHNYIDRAKKIDNLDDGIIQIGGMSWGDHTLGKHCDGTWITFYALTALTNRTGTQTIDFCNITRLQLIIEGELFIDWMDGERVGGGPESYDWFKMLLVTFRLASQKNLCSETVERTSRAERRRCKHDGFGCSDIRVVRLRHSQRSTGTAGGGREYSCRWRVAGHWRQQWYPSVEDHRPIWIMDHIKGPEDKPFRGGDRVKIV